MKLNCFRAPASVLAVPALAVFAAFTAPACTETGCDAVYTYHRIEMARDFDVPPSGVSSLVVRMCVGATCVDASPADGRFVDPGPPRGGGPVEEATVTADAATNRGRVVVVFKVGDGSADRLRITITDAAGRTVHESSAGVGWSDGECHPEPIKTKV